MALLHHPRSAWPFVHVIIQVFLRSLCKLTRVNKFFFQVKGFFKMGFQGHQGPSTEYSTYLYNT